MPDQAYFPVNKMTEERKHICDNLRRLRKEKGLNQTELCEEIEGLGQARYSKIESGKAEPSLSTLEKLASYYGVPVHALMQEYDPEREALLEKIQSLQKDSQKTLSKALDDREVLLESLRKLQSNDQEGPELEP
ncbi:MAG TPA: hypothetical protein DCP28_35045 [Cytophagales bacterium]|nr:hypothetical protein [Cytophagales bacterium]